MFNVAIQFWAVYLSLTTFECVDKHMECVLFISVCAREGHMKCTRNLFTHNQVTHRNTLRQIHKTLTLIITNQSKICQMWIDSYGCIEQTFLRYSVYWNDNLVLSCINCVQAIYSFRQEQVQNLGGVGEGKGLLLDKIISLDHIWVLLVSEWARVNYLEWAS